MRIFDGLDDLASAVGTHLGYSEWHVIDQARVNGFADATGDYQWIHTDPDRAATGPFGQTIAHGYLTLSLQPMLLTEIYEVRGLTMMINYGLNRVRFPSPAVVGSRVRGGAELLELVPSQGGVQAIVRVTIESDASSKPVCVAESVALLVP